MVYGLDWRQIALWTAGLPECAVYDHPRRRVEGAEGQKGLHLNEDIYAGISAFGRGGRIKAYGVLPLWYRP